VYRVQYSKRAYRIEKCMLNLAVKIKTGTCLSYSKMADRSHNPWSSGGIIIVVHVASVSILFQDGGRKRKPHVYSGGKIRKNEH
jgi:hypothetical protein